MAVQPDAAPSRGSGPGHARRGLRAELPALPPVLRLLVPEGSPGLRRGPGPAWAVQRVGCAGCCRNGHQRDVPGAVLRAVAVHAGAGPHAPTLAGDHLDRSRAGHRRRGDRHCSAYLSRKSSIVHGPGSHPVRLRHHHRDEHASELALCESRPALERRSQLGSCGSGRRGAGPPVRRAGAAAFRARPARPPAYSFEVWLASALLAVTFPFLVIFAELFQFWPLSGRSRSGRPHARTSQIPGAS